MVLIYVMQIFSVLEQNIVLLEMLNKKKQKNTAFCSAAIDLIRNS